MNKPITFGTVCVFVFGVALGIGVEKFVNKYGVKISIVSKDDAQDLIESESEDEDEY